MYMKTALLEAARLLAPRRRVSTHTQARRKFTRTHALTRIYNSHLFALICYKLRSLGRHLREGTRV